MKRVMTFMLLALATQAYAQQQEIPWLTQAEELPSYIQAELQKQMGGPTFVMVQLPDPNVAPPPTQSGQFKLGFDHVEPCPVDAPYCPSGNRIYVRIDSDTGTHALPLDAAATQITGFKIFDSPAANQKFGIVNAKTFFGASPVPLHEVVNMETGQNVINIFSDNDPILSPTGRYLLYIIRTIQGPYGRTYFPPVSVYDLLARPEDNARIGLDLPSGKMGRQGYPGEGQEAPRITTPHWLDTDVVAILDAFIKTDQVQLTVIDLRERRRATLLDSQELNSYCPNFPKFEVQDIRHVPNTDTLQLTLSPCGKIEIHIPRL